MGVTYYLTGDAILDNLDRLAAVGLESASRVQLMPEAPPP